MSRKVLDFLLEYPWPGNVRELENCIERAVVMSPEDTLSADLLPEEITSYRPVGARRRRAVQKGDVGLRRALGEFLETRGDLAEARGELARMVEEAAIRKALESPGVSQRELAKRLGLSRVTLRKKLKEYGLG